jgi:hypothetical protein
MKVSVNYDDTDVAKALSKIIKDSNAEEFVKLLTPMICCSNQAVDHFFKLMIGNKLPEIIPNGTLCRIAVNNLGYGSNKQAITDKFADQDGKVVVSVKEFRGYHEYSHYNVDFTDILSDGTIKKDYTYVNLNDLEVIEEF